MVLHSKKHRGHTSAMSVVQSIIIPTATKGTQLKSPPEDHPFNMFHPPTCFIIEVRNDGLCQSLHKIDDGILASPNSV